MPSEAAVVLKDIEHARHLRENENAMSLRLCLADQLVKHLELCAVFDEMLTLNKGRAGLLALKQVAVVRALAELHEDIE